MDELRDIFLRLFADKVSLSTVDPDAVVFGPANTLGLASMETLRFVAALLPLYGDRVYDLKVEEITTLRSVYDQLTQSGTTR